MYCPQIFSAWTPMSTFPDLLLEMPRYCYPIVNFPPKETKILTPFLPCAWQLLNNFTELGISQHSGRIINKTEYCEISFRLRTFISITNIIKWACSIQLGISLMAFGLVMSNCICLCQCFPNCVPRHISVSLLVQWCVANWT